MFGICHSFAIRYSAFVIGSRRMSNDLAQTVMRRIEALGRISEERQRLTRTFCSSAMRRANDLVAAWMRKAGMTVREDAIGNVIGRCSVQGPPSIAHSPLSARRSSQAVACSAEKVLLMGSHLDTVHDAGRFDGALGVILAIACVEQMRRRRHACRSPWKSSGLPRRKAFGSRAPISVAESWRELLTPRICSAKTLTE